MKTDTVRMREVMNTAGMGDAFRLRILSIVSAHSAFPIDHAINRRAEDARALARFAVDGEVAIRVWQRDCDCVEFTQLKRIPATMLDYWKLQSEMHEDAEGPISFRILSPEEAAEFKPASHDRATAAFENGHPWSV